MGTAPTQDRGGIERSDVRTFVCPKTKVKNFIQGRISKSIYGSKMVFHMMMCLYETN